MPRRVRTAPARGIRSVGAGAERLSGNAAAAQET